MNKVMLLGRLTKDPELQKVAGDISLCKFGLAVNKRFKKEGQTDADFFNVLVWNKQADISQKYLNKGSLVCLVGRIEIDKWQDKEGNNRYTTNIIADEVHFAGSNSNTSPETIDTSVGNTSEKKNTNNHLDDDLPF